MFILKKFVNRDFWVFYECNIYYLYVLIFWIWIYIKCLVNICIVLKYDLFIVDIMKNNFLCFDSKRVNWCEVEVDFFVIKM